LQRSVTETRSSERAVGGVGDHFSTHDPYPFRAVLFLHRSATLLHLFRLRSGTRQRRVAVRRGSAIAMLASPENQPEPVLQHHARFRPPLRAASARIRSISSNVIASEADSRCP